MGQGGCPIIYIRTHHKIIKIACQLPLGWIISKHNSLVDIRVRPYIKGGVYSVSLGVIIVKL